MTKSGSDSFFKNRHVIFSRSDEMGLVLHLTVMAQKTFCL